ncbi:MAG TPA: ABC transporter substrate-binding protein, partial [Ilumatobacteraceae bacterium]|nr:ABC transporter substrate-binding protein [Ilumatobacteraceae bacterium]
MEDQTWPERPIYSRRRILALGGAAAAAAAFLAACGSDDNGNTSATTTPAGGSGAPSDTAAPDTAAPTPTETVAVNTTEPTSGGPNAAKFGGGGGDGTVKIGFTAPLTGALAGFGEANPFILDSINKLTADGIMLGDKSYKVEIIQKDVESSSDTAASQAGSLILDDGVDLMLAIATPEMINPVADQCEANGVPCLSTLAPWQPYFLGRGGDPAKGFDWTYHFFWGADQLVGVFADMWQTVETNKIVGLLCPNDPDGNALASPDTGFPAGAKANGYTMIDPGRFEDGTTDFSGIIGQFKQQNVEIITGIPIPPDFANFWTQANQQGLKPKLVTMAKAVLFSSAVEALGD